MDLGRGGNMDGWGGGQEAKTFETLLNYLGTLDHPGTFSIIILSLAAPMNASSSLMFSLSTHCHPAAILFVP